MKRILMMVPMSAALIGTAPAPAPEKISPSEIVAAAPAEAWKSIPAEDIIVIDLAAGGRVVMQLAPQFAPVHVANIRALARAGFWQGASVYRVQDNYVAQWGNNDSAKPWPSGVVAKPPAEYSRPLAGLTITPLGNGDAYAPAAGFADGWPIAYSPSQGWATLTHCYAAVGAGRDLAPDTGTGGELYAIIGHGTRHMDRNLAIVGRVVAGIEHLSSLPRGTEELGMYKDKGRALPIRSVRVAADIPAGERPAFQYLDTVSDSFKRYVAKRRHRYDDFYLVSADGADLCNVPIPIRAQP